MKQHVQRIHKSGRVLYSCAECNLQFRLVSKFNKHRLEKHAEEKPHICSVCGFRFKRVGSLERHKLVHGDKTLGCRYCVKKFRTESVVKFHEKKVHADVYVKARRKSKATQKHALKTEQVNSNAIGFEQKTPQMDDIFEEFA